MTRVYAMAAAGFIALAIWGSLFPFHFHPVPLDDAVSRFWNPWPIDGTTWSETDAISNLLLFVPIGLFLAAALAHALSAGVAVAVVLTAGVVLSTLIEFGQAFVVFRTPSMVDVLTESAGTASGIALWRVARAHIERVAGAGTTLWRRSTGVERLLLTYSALFAMAWLFPFDFTIRLNEIQDKYAHKRLLLPFTPSPDAASTMELRLMLAAAVPFGAAATCGGGPARQRSFAGAFVLASTSLLLLTAAQAAVFSRTTDATLLIAALPGVVAGAAAARHGLRAAR